MASNGANQAATEGTAQPLATLDHAKGMVSADQAGLLGSAGSDFDKGDLSIPFLRILQGLSPYVTKGDPKYTKEADTGMIVETVTPAFYDGMEKGIIVIPVMYQRSYTEWAPNRGGLVKDHGSDGTILASCKTETDDQGKKKLVTPDGNDLAEAAQYFVLYGLPPADKKTPIDFEQAILTMSGTQWKKSRDWNTNMSRLKLHTPDGALIKNPLPFAAAYLLKTVVEKKDANTYFGWKIERYDYTLNLPGGDAIIQYASDFRKLAASGAVKGNDGGVTEDGEDKIPF